MSGVILFPRRENQVTNLATPAAVLQFFQMRFPEVAQLMPASEAEAFLQRSSSRILTIHCNRYHHGDSVLIIGGAAHSVSASIGQGCNAALEAVVIVDRLLDEYARFSPSLTKLVFESSAPYFEILNAYKGWIAKVKKSNQQFFEAP